MVGNDIEKEIKEEGLIKLNKGYSIFMIMQFIIYEYFIFIKEELKLRGLIFIFYYQLINIVKLNVFY